MHKQDFEIMHSRFAMTEAGMEILQVVAKVTDHVGIRHSEKGEEISILKTQTINVAIPVKELPNLNRRKYVMDKVKMVYKLTKQAEAEADMFVGYKTTVNVH